MKEYLNLFIVAMVLYFETYFFNEIKEGVVFVDIASPFRRVLDPSGKTDRFTISGVITEVFAHVSIIVNIALIIFGIFLIVVLKSNGLLEHGIYWH